MVNKPNGWRWDSTRHSLAAQGIKTSRRIPPISMRTHGFLVGERVVEPMSTRSYMMTKERAEELAATAKDFLGDGLPEGKDYDEYLRKRDTDTKRNDVVGKLDDDVAAGKMTAKDRKDFLETYYSHAEREHLGKITDAEQFNDEVDRKLEWFRNSHDNSKKIFG